MHLDGAVIELIRLRCTKQLPWMSGLGHPCRCNVQQPTGLSRDIYPVQGIFTEYFLNNLGDSSWDPTGCTDVVANFGQWLAASDLDQPFSIHMYVDMLTGMIGHLQQLRLQGVNVLWLTTNSFPLWHGTW